MDFLSHVEYLIWLGGVFPGGSDGKQSACNSGDTDSNPGLERHPGEGNGNPFQYSCLENSMDRGAWRATVHGYVISNFLIQGSLQEAGLG